MKKTIIYSFAIASALSIVSCKTDFDTDVADITPVSGEADFSNYIALGNSLTSGYRDGTLYIDGQNESYPLMIAEQMQKAGGGAFTQPLMQDNIGGFINIPNFPGKLTLNNALSPVPSSPAGNLDIIGGTGKKFNNMGVPGAKSFHLLVSGYGNPAGLATETANPYFVRFATSPSTSVIDDAIAQAPTFFSLWIGNNDVLGYATSGGVGTNQKGNTDLTTYKSNDITDPNLFAGSIKNILDKLKATGASKGVIANIPDVTSIPFFTTVPYNAVPLTKEQAEQLNTIIDQLRPVLKLHNQEDRVVTLKEGNNPLLIKDETLKDLSSTIKLGLMSKGVSEQEATIIGNVLGQARHATNKDYILLTTASIINTSPSKKLPLLDKYGISYPLEDKHVLTKDEVLEILAATKAYNSSIKSLADAYGLAFVDANAKMIELSQNSGLQFNAVRYNATFVTGGAFSLDGVHLTGRGYAVIANEFIKAINAKYNSTLPQVNPNRYSGIKFP